MQNDSRILIFGASGQLGQALCKQLPNAFYPPKGTCDITSIASVRMVVGLVRPNVVINCAAMTNVDECEVDSHKAWLVNKQGSDNILQACEEVGSKYIFISSYYVFAGEFYRYDENNRVSPVNIYGRTKALAEESIQTWKGKIPTLIIRPSKIYSPYDERNFVWRWRRQILNTPSGRWTASGDYTNPISADDLASFIAVEWFDQTGLVHAFGPETLSNFGIINVLQQRYGNREGSVTLDDKRIGAFRPRNVVLTSKYHNFRAKTLEENLQLWDPR